MSTDELKAVIEAAIKETGATGMKEMGLVIKATMAKAAGKAEGSVVSDLVKKRLQG